MKRPGCRCADAHASEITMIRPAAAALMMRKAVCLATCQRQTSRIVASSRGVGGRQVRPARLKTERRATRSASIRSRVGA